MDSGNTTMSLSSPTPKKRGRPARPKGIVPQDLTTPSHTSGDTSSVSVLPESTLSTSSYFPEVNINRIPTGSHMLDLVLGGGWAMGRIANLVGDRSTGKSLLSIEACATFIRKYPKGRVVYIETEFAFDKEYAVSVGLPLDSVEFPNESEEAPAIDTIEKLFDKLTALSTDSFKHETFVVVDSLDALSDEAEMSRGISDASYGSGKAKKLSEMFRRLNATLSKKNFGILIVSQVRDNIGAMFGEKHTRSGGKALDFYASQVVWLANTGKIDKVRGKIKRVIGVEIKAKCKKNKTGLPFRECSFPIYFSFGVEDLASCMDFIDSIDTSTKVCDKSYNEIMSHFDKYTQEEYNAVLVEARKKATELWHEIENRFTIQRKKYSP